MARTATDGRGFYLDVTGSDTGGWVLMIDNLGSEGVTAENHQFAGVVINAADKEAFILDLAQAMNVSVFYDAEAPLPETAVLLEYFHSGCQNVSSAVFAASAESTMKPNSARFAT